MQATSLYNLPQNVQESGEHITQLINTLFDDR